VKRAAWLLVVAACASGSERVRPASEAANPETTAPSTAAAPPTGAGAGSAQVTPAQPAPPAPPAKAASIEMTFAGDVHFGRYKPWGYRAIPAETHDPFAEVEALLDSDHALVNLETTVLPEFPEHSPYGTLMRFVTTPNRVATLVQHKVDTVTLANNHYWDMKHAGAETTPKLVAELGLNVLGASRAEAPFIRVETIDVKGWKVGFIAVATECNTDWETATLKLPWAERDKIGAAVQPVVEAARADHDLVIVSPHWGKEYLDVPERWQITAARRWIDAGADAVIGHHPHVLQGIEMYKDHVIAYSLGNFLFDNTTSNRKWGGVLRVTFGQRDDGAACVKDIGFSPTITLRTASEDEKRIRLARVTPAVDKDFTTIAGRVVELSTAKGLQKTTWTVDGARITTTPTCQ
jgi:poly-gamma-glutamate capsule biosynthesis protein CapA/YwtB (metallophosphatase superfamily)